MPAASDPNGPPAASDREPASASDREPASASADEPQHEVVVSRTEPSVGLATVADRPAVVDTVVAAFANDPAFRFFFSDAEQFDDLARTFAGALFDVRVAIGTVWVADGGASVAMWEPPGGTARGLGDLFAADVMARLDAWDHAVHPLLPTTPFWYLGVLATHPAHTGEGLGRRVAEPGLARAAADGLPAYLETATDANVAMYVRRGWTVIDAVTSAEIGGATATVLRYDSPAA